MDRLHQRRLSLASDYWSEPLWDIGNRRQSTSRRSSSVSLADTRPRSLPRLAGTGSLSSFSFFLLGIETIQQGSIVRRDSTLVGSSFNGARRGHFEATKSGCGKHARVSLVCFIRSALWERRVVNLHTLRQTMRMESWRGSGIESILKDVTLCRRRLGRHGTTLWRWVLSYVWSHHSWCEDFRRLFLWRRGCYPNRNGSRYQSHRPLHRCRSL